MRISKREYKSLVKLIKSKPAAEVGLTLKFGVANLQTNKELQSLGHENLTKLISFLPHGLGTNVTSPVLTSIKEKARTSLAGLRVPHLDPESWPQVYRMQMRINNSRGGIKAGPLGQFYKLHPKGMSITTPIRGNVTWDTSNGGDLHIMGPWAEIIKMLSTSSCMFEAKFDDMFDNDVNVEFDQKYGPPKGDSPDWFEKISAMPLFVTLNTGALFSKTDDEGEVILNAPGEIVGLLGSKITAIASAAGPASLGNAALDTISEIKGVIEDRVVPVAQMGMDAYNMKKEEQLNKTMCTLTIGIGPMGRNYKVGTESMSGNDVLTLARQLR